MPIRFPLESMETPGGGWVGSVTVNVDGAAAALPGSVPLIGALTEPDMVMLGSAGGGVVFAGGTTAAGGVTGAVGVTGGVTGAVGVTGAGAGAPGTGNVTWRFTQVSVPQILIVAVVVPALVGVPLSVPLAARVTPAGSVFAAAETVAGAWTMVLPIVPGTGGPSVALTEVVASVVAGANNVSPVIVMPSISPPEKPQFPLGKARSGLSCSARLGSAVVATLLGASENRPAVLGATLAV